ncbi:MAG: hypothetical protein M3362_00135 [Acidobacteriota bacterium]|nr:hypothetical protein [Acidobacteriota bacterium]
MKISFISRDPRERALIPLSTVLAHGTDQLAIACAFLTAGGAESVKPYASLLTNDDSFIVVSAAPPTDMKALATLDKLAPGRVYIHLGALTPYEKKVGRGLMHSKVFYARNGGNCKAWIGSHNLTASAMLSVNCEAAITVEGPSEDGCFQDILAHLITCRDEAVPFNSYQPPDPPPSEDTLIIHAESSETIPAPPWFVHLTPADTRLDPVMRLAGNVWLYLYAPGALAPGYPTVAPVAAFSGTITAVNYTQHHPRRGISASWSSADYVIAEDSAGVFHFGKPGSSTLSPTQCVFRIDAIENTEVVWLSTKPVPELEPVVEKEWASEIPVRFARFFSGPSVYMNQLVHRLFGRQRLRVEVKANEVGARPTQLLAPASDLRTRCILNWLRRAKRRADLYTELSIAWTLSRVENDKRVEEHPVSSVVLSDRYALFATLY